MLINEILTNPLLFKNLTLDSKIALIRSSYPDIVFADDNIKDICVVKTQTQSKSAIPIYTLGHYQPVDMATVIDYRYDEIKYTIYYKDSYTVTEFSVVL